MQRFGADCYRECICLRGPEIISRCEEEGNSLDMYRVCMCLGDF